MCPDALFMHPNIEPVDIKLWLVLMVFCRDRGWCEATNKQLAETAKISVRTVARCLCRLEDAGFVVGESKGPHRTIKLRPEGWEQSPRPFALKMFAAG
jgi:hypothetical protein